MRPLRRPCASRHHSRHPLRVTEFALRRVEWASARASLTSVGHGALACISFNLFSQRERNASCDAFHARSESKTQSTFLRQARTHAARITAQGPLPLLVVVSVAFPSARHSTLLSSAFGCRADRRNRQASGDAWEETYVRIVNPVSVHGGKERHMKKRAARRKGKADDSHSAARVRGIFSSCNEILRTALDTACSRPALVPDGLFNFFSLPLRIALAFGVRCRATGRSARPCGWRATKAPCTFILHDGIA